MGERECVFSTPRAEPASSTLLDGPESSEMVVSGRVVLPCDRVGPVRSVEDPRPAGEEASNVGGWILECYEHVSPSPERCAIAFLRRRRAAAEAVSPVMSESRCDSSSVATASTVASLRGRFTVRPEITIRMRCEAERSPRRWAGATNRRERRAGPGRGDVPAFSPRSDHLTGPTRRAVPPCG